MCWGCKSWKIEIVHVQLYKSCCFLLGTPRSEKENRQKSKVSYKLSETVRNMETVKQLKYIKKSADDFAS